MKKIISMIGLLLGLSLTASLMAQQSHSVGAVPTSKVQKTNKQRGQAISPEKARLMKQREAQKAKAFKAKKKSRRAIIAEGGDPDATIKKLAQKETDAYLQRIQEDPKGVQKWQSLSEEDKAKFRENVYQKMLLRERNRLNQK